MNSQQKLPIYTAHAPEPVGAYSQGIVSDGFIFTSGQVGIDRTGKLVGEDAVSQALQIFKNLEMIFSAAGASTSTIVKATLYLKDIQDFKAVNELYAAWVEQPAPARTTIGVSQLPFGALIEVECIAHV